MKTIGVIGAGAAGLCAIRHSLANDLLPVAWEHGSSIGGTWKYTELVKEDEHGFPVYSSMYKNLRTNLPKEIMNFPDFPFPEEDDSYIHHTSVLKYLELYAESFELKPYIQFNQHINHVEPIFNGEGPPSWKVSFEDLNNGKSSTKTVDFLMICNGHFSKPKYPFIRNQEGFKGIQLHSHNYRDPHAFFGQEVAVLGAGPSGIDISLELCKEACRVFLIHNKKTPLPSKLPINIMQRFGIIAQSVEGGFILNTGMHIKADAIIFCTGYEYDFDFLSPKCKVIVEDNKVNLFRHVLNIDFPTMGFAGIPYQVLPFPMFDIQIRFLMKIFTGQLKSPTREESIQADRKEMNGRVLVDLKMAHWHRLGFYQWHYVDILAEEAQLVPYPKYIKMIYDSSRSHMMKSTAKFKHFKYLVTGPKSFKILNKTE